MAERKYPQAERDIIRHELGHAVAARAKGLPVERIVFTAYDAGAEIDVLPVIHDLDDVVTFVARRVTVLYAGAIAEAFTSDTAYEQARLDDYIHSTAANDYAKVRELVRIAAAAKGKGEQDRDRFQAILTAIDEESFEEAFEIIKRNIVAIRKATLEVDRRVRNEKIKSIQMTEIESYLQSISQTLIL